MNMNETTHPGEGFFFFGLKVKGGNFYVQDSAHLFDPEDWNTTPPHDAFKQPTMSSAKKTT